MVLASFSLRMRAGMLNSPSESPSSEERATALLLKREVTAAELRPGLFWTRPGAVEGATPADRFSFPYCVRYWEGTHEQQLGQ